MGETLGAILSKARRDLGKSLIDAEAATRIRARHLDALEKGDYETLPSPAYVKGYIISYAKFLMIDPEPLVELYENETGTAPREPMSLPDQVIVPRSQSHQLPMRTALAIVGVLAVLTLTIWGIGRLLSGPEPTPPIPAIPDESTTPGAAEIATAVPGIEDPSQETSPDASEDEAADLPVSSFTLQVRIAADGASWLRVTVDGLTAYEGTMTGGQSKEWEVTEEASIRIGRPSAVTVTRDGETVEIPSGDPPTLVLSASD